MRFGHDALRFGCVGLLECKILHEYLNVCSFCACYPVKIETHVQQYIPFACRADAVNLIECALKGKYATECVC